ncbi:RluA family pseudouridine synthase [Pontibacillus marinus]|uniref:Pseudouridine synthase n=1 Tax=Pontibacillus marinus BH030004 = DSM 16465 TaxID=1385511 RepID=A0A0A5G4Y0_9BACI|nr:RluA family pseudouridine synthase [Pontibacillus marinus]KGX87094.1 RNA pseudouridylate synthase [Pontibacillus marinus BH030004 = DSM 16465]
MKKKGNVKRSQDQRARRYKVRESTTLLPFLQQVLSHLSRNAVKSVLTSGNVVIEGNVVTKHNYPLQQDQVVEIHKDNVRSEHTLKGLTILYEDKDIIVVEKDSGLLSISSGKEKTLTAHRQLSDYVKTSHPKNRIFIVHRLDRDTSGVMIFAKSEQVKNKLQNAWKDMVKERTYIALVEGKMQKSEGVITSWLKETKTHVMYSSKKPNDGKKAVTHYKVLQSNLNVSLVKLNLETGRKNQIRVHMKDIGHSIVGDKKYGATSNSLGRLGLHAKEIAFKHPSRSEILHFESQVPEVFLEKF